MSSAVIQLVDKRIEVTLGPQQGPPGQDGADGVNGAKGDPGSAGEGYPTRTALAAATPAPSNLDDAYVTEPGAEGKFIFSTANLSAQVAQDSTRGIYVPRTGQDGSTGAWVRQFDGPIMVGWFLVTPGAFTTAAIIQKIENLRDAGQAVHFGSGTYAVGNIKVLKSGHWSGVGKGTVIQHTGGSGVCTFAVMAQGGTRFSHMRFTGLSTPDNADAKFPLYFSTRYAITDADTGIALDAEDIECDHLWFDNCDTGIRVSYDGIGPTNDVPGTTWYTPRRVHIHDCVFNDVLYQPVIPEAHDVTVERCFFKLSAKPVGGYRTFSHSLRVLGCNRVDIRNNRFEVPADYYAIAMMMAGVDNGLLNDAFRTARNVTIEGNRFVGGTIQSIHQGDLLRIVRNNFWNDPQSTTAQPALVFLGSETSPTYFGKIEIEDNYAVGFPSAVILENTSCHMISIKRNTIIGNKKTGGAFDIPVIKFQINDGQKLQDGVTQMPAPVMVEVEDNNLFCNPTTTGMMVTLVGNLTGMHLRYAGNKVAERPYSGASQIARQFGTSGTEPKISISKTSAFIALDTIAVDVSEDVVGDNTAMPAGFHAALLATSFFRPEQTVDAYPPDFA